MVQLRGPADLLDMQNLVGNRAAEDLLRARTGRGMGAGPDPNSPHRGGAPVVQAQSTGAAQTPGTGGAAGGLTPVQRVERAVAANDLAQVIAIQHELRQQMRADPLHPPEEARQGLAVARHLVMDRIAAIRDSYAPRLAQDSTGSSGVDNTGPLETVESLMDEECAPYLNVLLEGDPQYRYEHFNTVVAEKVFAAVRLHSARRAVGQIGHRAQAEAEARARGNLPTGEWCGAFAFTQAEQGGGFDRRWVENMQGEGGIQDALNYRGSMARTWVWVFDHWMSLRDYHAQRNAVRWYEAIFQAPPSRGIQPGDLVLIDNMLGNRPDHITTAVSFDGRFLTTVGGNQGEGEQGVSRSRQAIDLQQNPEPNDVRRLNARGQPIQEADPTKRKNVRVHGVGRWSVVDYETHVYVISPQMPDRPPSAAVLAQRS